MTDVELYQYRIEHLLCTNCGEPIERKSGRMCPTCAKLKRAKDAIRRENLTDEDRQKKNEYYKAWRERHKGYAKMKYEMAKAQGLCIQCGKPKDNPDKVRCSACSKYQGKIHEAKVKGLSDEQRERKKAYLKEYHKTHYRKKKEEKPQSMSRAEALEELGSLIVPKDGRQDRLAEAYEMAIHDMQAISALSDELKAIGRECMDKDVLIGFNMAIALFNKHLGGGAE